MTAYARAVLAGEIVAGELVRLACQRHLDDLSEGYKRGLFFDAEAALKYIGFFEDVLRLPEITDREDAPEAEETEYEVTGDEAPFILAPSQKFIVGSLFGWKTTEGRRRFRVAYCEMGKGNGKSPLAAGIALAGLCVDGERRAQIYSAAVNRDQAKIIFEDAKAMVVASPDLTEAVSATKNNLAYLKTGSFFRPVSSEGRGLDGKRVHMALIDEVHEHRNATVVEKMRAGTKGRRNPLVFEITNSGFDRKSVCRQHHDYSVQVLKRSIPNDAWFAFIAALDKGDDPFKDESCWPKANPLLGVSITHTYLREQVTEAIGMPAKKNLVLRLNFCVWTEQATRAIEADIWDRGAAPVDRVQLRGRPCFSGLDLSSIEDVTALLHCFPPIPEDPPGMPFRFLSRFWVPEATLVKRTERDGIPYKLWADEGYIEATEGDIVDYNVIQKRIIEDREEFDIKEIAIDRWNSTHLQTNLTGEGFTMVPFGQGYHSMGPACRDFFKHLKTGMLNHGGDPVLRWMALNLAVMSDPAGAMKPAKDKSGDKIDGIVAMIMALARAVATPVVRSFWETMTLPAPETGNPQ